MTGTQTKGEMHGCIVCGKLYQLYVVYDANGRFIDSKLMSLGGKLVPNAVRPLVACDHHSDTEIKTAVERVFGMSSKDDDL